MTMERDCPSLLIEKAFSKVRCFLSSVAKLLQFFSIVSHTKIILGLTKKASEKISFVSLKVLVLEDKNFKLVVNNFQQSQSQSVTEASLCHSLDRPFEDGLEKKGKGGGNGMKVRRPVEVTYEKNKTISDVQTNTKFSL
jgi:hypothetical protein